MIINSHRHEWVTDSAIDPTLTSLNIVSLSNYEPYEYLLYALPNSERRNDGRLTDKWLKRYSHIENGGWWCSSVNILTGKDSEWGCFKPDTPYHSEEKPKGFDPLSPAKNKIIKYEHPPKTKTGIFALKASFNLTWNIIKRQNEEAKNQWIQRLWNATAQPNQKIKANTNQFKQERENRSTQSLTREDRTQSFPTWSFGEFSKACRGREYGEIERILHAIRNKRRNGSTQPEDFDSGRIERFISLEDREFWQWLIATPSIPLIITEGAKKAGAILTAGYAAIALPGIYGGYRQPKNDWGQKIGKPYLIPELEILAENGREIIFCFDQDQKPATIKNVRTAIKTTGGLLAQKGCQVSVISWNTKEKGVDDLIVAKGVDFFHVLYQNRVPLSKFNLISLLDLSKYNPLIVDERYLSDTLVAPSTASLIGLKSAKGTGKTEWMTKIVEQATRRGQRVIVLTHREQLAITLAFRFGIDYRTEIRTSVTKGSLGYALCIDSLHPHANPPFNPDEWREALVIIDEAEQVFWHTLDSDTCQKNRVAIIDSFKQLLQTAVGTGGKVYLADADLSPIALDYVRALIGFPVETWVVVNKHNPNQGKRKLISYSGNDPRKLIDALIRHIQEGFRVLVHTTGQKAQSKWGSINLESYLKKKFKQLKILRIDSESVSEPGHPAYGCMDSLNQILSGYDIVICSPVVETGVSIDIKGHFNSVWCIAMGVQTVDAVCQTTERLRENVPRHIWIKTTAKGNRIGNGSTSIKGLLYSEHKLTSANIRLLQQADINDFDELDVNYSRESFHTWAKRATIINDGKNNYRASILSKLIDEGYELYNPDNPTQPERVNIELKQVRNQNYQEFCLEVSEIETPDDLELEELKTKRAKTKTERLKEKKGNLAKRYGVEVTPDLVEKDDNGWYNQLKLHYYLTIGNIYLAQRDQRSLAGLTENSKGQAFKPDINKRTLSAQIKCFEIIKLEQFLDPEAKFTANSLADWLEMVQKYWYEIKILLGVNINREQDSAIAVAQRILKKLGLKMEYLYTRGSRKSKQRVYGGCKLDTDGREQVFANWLAKDEQISQPESVLTLF